MSDAVSDHIVVDAPADAVMDVIGDYEAYPQWQPEVLEAEILEADEDGWARLVRYRVDAKVFTAAYVLRYSYTDRSIRWGLEESEQLRALDGVYELSELDGDRTRVAYQLEVVPAVRMPGMLRRQAAKRIVDNALKGLKQRVEATGTAGDRSS